MDIDWLMTLGAFLVAIIVGLTGMGGGALMTPMLVLFFGVPPLAAVSSDLVAAAVMKPVGSAVHLRRGTVNLELVKWLCVVVPSAFGGVVLAKLLGDGEQVQSAIKIALGVALLIAAAGLVGRAYLRLAERARARDGRLGPDPQGPPKVVLRKGPTILVGVIGGVIVGLTSVGSGSLIIIALMMLYPGLKASELVGTDLLQAVPLVFSAAIGHLLFGDFQLQITAALLIGSIPGVWLGARISSRAPGGLVRRVLAFVLLASALKLLGVGNQATALILLSALIVAPVVWALIRRHHGFAMFALQEQGPRRARTD